LLSSLLNATKCDNPTFSAEAETSAPQSSFLNVMCQLDRQINHHSSVANLTCTLETYLSVCYYEPPLDVHNSLHTKRSP